MPGGSKQKIKFTSLGGAFFVFVITGGTFLTLVQVTFDPQWYATIMGGEMGKLFAPIFCLGSGVICFFSLFRIFQFFLLYQDGQSLFF